MYCEASHNSPNSPTMNLLSLFVGELSELGEWLPQKKEVVFIRLIRTIRRR